MDKTRYATGVDGEETDYRAAFIFLLKKYEIKLWKYDVKYHSVAPEAIGQPEQNPGPLVGV